MGRAVVDDDVLTTHKDAETANHMSRALLKQQGWTDAKVQAWCLANSATGPAAESKTTHPSNAAVSDEPTPPQETIIELTDGELTPVGLECLLQWCCGCKSALRNLVRMDVSRNPRLGALGCEKLLKFWQSQGCAVACPRLDTLYMEECGIRDHDSGAVLGALYRAVAGNPRARYVSLFPGNYGLGSYRESVENWLCYALAANRREAAQMQLQAGSKGSLGSALALAPASK